MGRGRRWNKPKPESEKTVEEKKAEAASRIGTISLEEIKSKKFQFKITKEYDEDGNIIVTAKEEIIERYQNARKKYGLEPIKIFVWKIDVLTGKAKLIDQQGELSEIPNYCFKEISELKSFDIPDSVETIGNNAFSYSGLKSITIPKNVIIIGTNAFSYCDDLEKVVFSEGLETIGVNAFSHCSKLQFDRDDFIPSSVKTIKSAAFLETGVTSVDLSKNDVLINNSCFEMCRKLVSLDFPIGIKQIPKECCRGCIALETINLNQLEVLETINDFAFEECTSLTMINLPDRSPEEKPIIIKTGAFKSCINLSKINGIRDNDSVYQEAFYNCKNLKIRLPKIELSTIDSTFTDNSNGITIKKGRRIYTGGENEAIGKLLPFSNISEGRRISEKDILSIVLPLFKKGRDDKFDNNKWILYISESALELNDLKEEYDALKKSTDITK